MRSMKYFLHDYARTTSSFGFLEGKFDYVAQKMLDRCQDANDFANLKWKVKSNLTEGILSQKLDLLLPLPRIGNNKTLICETNSSWCAYFTNGWHGNDLSQIGYVAKRWPTRAVRAVLSFDRETLSPNSTQFSLYTPQPDGELNVRSVSAHKEGRWEFEEYGERLPFEEVQSYSARKIRDRLTAEMVERYCRQLGIELFDPDFYAGRGSIIHTYPVPGVTFTEHFPNQSR